jgi:hypothetical protein
MEIDGTRLTLTEQKILYLDRPGVGMPPSVVSADEAAVFRFDSGNAIHGRLKFIQSSHCSMAKFCAT